LTTEERQQLEWLVRGGKTAVRTVKRGPLLRDAARVVEAICRPEQTYVCVWSHGQTERRHLHILAQPVTTALVAQYGGLRSEQLQVRLMTTAEPPDPAELERFCTDARQRFAAGRSESDASRQR
jgi:hypothetical protein